MQSYRTVAVILQYSSNLGRILTVSYRCKILRVSLPSVQGASDGKFINIILKIFVFGWPFIIDLCIISPLML